MGNRVMERPNLSGGTVARHHVPKAVRRSRKRALRKTAGALKPAELAEGLRQTPAPQVATQAPKPRKLIERPSRKPEVQVAAKVPTPIEVLVKAPKPVTLFERLTKRRAPRKAPEAQKPEEPALPAPPPVQEPVAEKAKPRGVDTFEDGAIEWGIKREGEGKEPTGSGT